MLLQHHAVLLQQAEKIRQDRTHVYEQLRLIDGVQPFTSEANFILFRVTHATQVFEGIKQRGVLIRNLSMSHPLLADCLRVTVGTPQENALFLSALKESLV